jgi:hypothetical protein
VAQVPRWSVCRTSRARLLGAGRTQEILGHVPEIDPPSEFRAGAKHAKKGVSLRCAVEQTNSWLVNFEQLRRNTDWKVSDWPAQLALTSGHRRELIDWRGHWNFLSRLEAIRATS